MLDLNGYLMVGDASSCSVTGSPATLNGPVLHGGRIVKVESLSNERNVGLQGGVLVAEFKSQSYSAFAHLG